MHPCILSWSGGKDAAWALHKIQSRYRVAGLVTLLWETQHHSAFQGIDKTILDAQARALNLPIMYQSIPIGASNAIYETAFAQLLQQARAEIDSTLHHIVFGDLFLDDLRQYREQLCARLGWTGVFPLFGADTKQLANAMLQGDLKARISCINTQFMDRSFAGNEFDQTLIERLSSTIDPCGEHGEFHTCVYALPEFNAPLLIHRNGEREQGDFVYTDWQLN